MQLAFTSADGSAFECRISFGTHDYANVNFLEFARKDVPLHLSFRQRRQVVVYNQFLAGSWGPERPLAVELAPDGNVLRIEFFLGVATVLVNGIKIGAFELPEATDGTEEPVHFVSYNGGIESAKLQGEAFEHRKGRGILLSDQPFLLEGWGFDPASIEQELSVCLVGTEQCLPLAVLPAPEHAKEQKAPTDRIGVLSLVPGWVWSHVAEDADSIEFQLTANGRACGLPFTLTREAISEMAETVCKAGPGGNSLELLTALEHCRFASLEASLSHDARTVLAEASRRYRLGAFYEPTVGDKPDDIEAPPGVRIGDLLEEPDDEDSIESGVIFSSSGAFGKDKPKTAADASLIDGLPPVQAHLKRFSALMNGLSPSDMTDVVREHGLEMLETDAERRDLLLIVARNFCHADRFAELLGLAKSYDLTEMPLKADGWSMSLTLPYLYKAGRSKDLVERVNALPSFEGWVDNCALGWTIRSVLLDRPLNFSEQQREDMVSSFLRFLLRLADDYFSTVSSYDLVRTCVVLVEVLPTLAEDQQDWAVDTVASLYGRSEQFWRLVASSQAAGRIEVLPLALERARKRFTELRDALESSDPLRAIDALPRDGSDANRVKREVASASLAKGDLANIVLEASQGGLPSGSQQGHDALIRALAFPVDGPELPDFASAGRRAIRKLTPEVRRSLHPEQQTGAAEKARLLLAAPIEDEEARAALLSAFIQDCALISSWRDEYLGYGLMISLMTGALTNRDGALADAVPPQIVELMQQLDSEELDSVFAAPSVTTALWSLRQAPGLDRSDSAQSVLELFDDAVKTLPEPFEATNSSLVPTTGISAFHNILVVVYSCQPNLDTRIAALRETWLKDLEARGLSYVVLVGDGDGRFEGDVVYVDAPDSYEALPQKTLAMAEWAIENTGFAHIYKIDDDCFLEPDEAIGSLNYAKYPYYGRRLRRAPGHTDRIWHHGRGSVGNAAMEIDKSPEPAEYADGSTGYVLNRHAMEELVNTSNTRNGAWLRLVSFNEDKLVGDTLALSGLRVSNRAYFSTILRRSYSKGLSAGRWENGFLPSKASPSVVAHLDNVSLQPVAAKVRETSSLWPKRLWPSFQRVKLGSNNLQVELISPVEKLEAVNASDLCVVACVRNELSMLPMFLNHYRKLGVTGFLISDNCSDDGTLEYLYEQPDVATFSAESDYSETQYGVAWQHALISQLRMNRWSLVADADEFLVLPDGINSMSELMNSSDFKQADCGRIFMLDLYPEGSLSEATFANGDPFAELTHCDREPFIHAWNPGPYDDAVSWTSALRHRLLSGSRSILYVAQKCALIRYKPWMRFSAGLHYASEVNMAGRDLIFGHMKYHAEFHERARLETARGQHFNNAEEYRKYLNLMSEGRERIFDPEISVPWRECDWVRRTLSGSTEMTEPRAAE